jgi:hypothetical protein
LGPNTFVVPHGKLETVSFFASDKVKKAAREEAILAAKEYSKMRRHQAIVYEYENIEEAIASLNKAEWKGLQRIATTKYKEGVASDRESLSDLERFRLQQAAAFYRTIMQCTGIAID